MIIKKLKDFKNWDEIDEFSNFSYPWQKEVPPKTIFKTYHDEHYLHFKFDAYGSKPFVYVKDNNKIEVIYSERVELFFRSNEKMKPYFCLEMDPLGRILDYKASYYRSFDRAWNWPEQLMTKTEIEKDSYSVCGKLSLGVLKELGVLNNGNVEAGIFRGHCLGLRGKEAKINWISWINPGTEQPDFHVPSAFGRLELQ